MAGLLLSHLVFDGFDALSDLRRTRRGRRHIGIVVLRIEIEIV